MPNHCESDVQLYAYEKPEQLKALVTLMGLDKEEPEFDLGKIVAYPAEYAERDELCRRIAGENATATEVLAAKAEYIEKYGEPEHGFYRDGYNTGGYEWCCSHWGTKWGCYEVNVDTIDEEHASFHFQSAWSPPTANVFLALSAMFPDVEIRHQYFEWGAGYQGCATYSNGAQTMQSQCAYNGPRGG